MVSSIKLANLWRVISDVDLQRIRTAAQSPFEIVVVADDPALADRVCTGLGALPGGGVHPYVHAIDPDTVQHRPVSPLVVVLATGTSELSVRMKDVDHHCIRERWPRLTLVVGTDDRVAAARRIAEHARVAVVDPVSAPGPLLAAIVDAVEGDTRLAVAAALPVFRPVVADAIVDETSKANASFALTTGIAKTIPVLTVPVSLGDMVILTKNQLIMGYRIALAAGRNDDPRSMMTEILGVIGGGFMFRQLARQLAGLIPVIGIVPKVVVAYAGTYAIGRALSAWALAGVEVTSESLGRYTSDGLARGRDVAQQMVTQMKGGARAPGRGWRRLRGWLPTRRGQPPPADPA